MRAVMRAGERGQMKAIVFEGKAASMVLGRCRTAC